MSVARQRRATHKARKKKQAHQKQREQFEREMRRMPSIPTATMHPFYTLDTSALLAGLAAISIKEGT